MQRTIKSLKSFSRDERPAYLSVDYCDSPVFHDKTLSSPKPTLLDTPWPGQEPKSRPPSHTPKPSSSNPHKSQLFSKPKPEEKREFSRSKTDLPLGKSPEIAKSENYYQEHLHKTFQAIKFIRNLPPVDLGQLKQKRVNLPKRIGYKLKKTIIFDLDETLVHCVQEGFDAEVVLPVTFDTGDSMGVGFNIRPYAREVLAEASKYFEVVVFTAAQKAYADTILDHLDPKGELIHHRLYRESCLRIEGVYMKDLRIFNNRRIQDLVIVDNSAYSFGYHLDNGVPIVSWHDDPYDRELFNLMHYLKILARCEDVRVLNRQYFKLRTFYEDYLQEFGRKNSPKGVGRILGFFQ